MQTSKTSQYKSVPVKMPNGKIRKAELRSKTHEGFRTARVTIDGKRLRGRVTNRHGYEDGRALEFQANTIDALVFRGVKSFVTL